MKLGPCLPGYTHAFDCVAAQGQLGEAQQQLQGQQAVGQMQQQLQEYEQWFAHYQASAR